MEVKTNLGEIKLSLELSENDLKGIEDAVTRAFRRAIIGAVKSCIEYGFIGDIAKAFAPPTAADLFRGTAHVAPAKPAAAPPAPPAPKPAAPPPYRSPGAPWGNVDLATGQPEEAEAPPASPRVTRLPEMPARGLNYGLRPQPRDIPPHDPVPPVNGEAKAEPAPPYVKPGGRMPSVGLLCPTVQHRPEGYILTSEAYEIIGGTAPSATLNEWIRNKKVKAVVVASYKPPTKGLHGRLMVERAGLDARNAIRQANPLHKAHSTPDARN